MQIEKLTSQINQQIGLIQQAVAADKIPDFKPVQQAIDIFTSEMKKLDAPSARQYMSLLAVWGEELRKSSEALNQKMSEIKEELNGIQSQNKAIRGYNYLRNDGN
ncbi:MAG TPA: hypothetical protein DIV86_00900 [Alphaproteobacteria bacterium]|nr:hypothetical protein [Alphaproteobacteria bacterium]